ncbi:MAG TPA: alpha/beta hydrolase [Myxococcota bacterium]|nr:alpha/beta hydrolase [Myxococcota bacterium]
MDGRITLADGRTVGYADYGTPGQTPVLWCHGGPGSRLEPSGIAPAAGAAGFRIIGIDRPGYGLSTPQPGRAIADWVNDGLTVASHLGVREFLCVGVSTGGAYALALAAATPRARGVIACCALSDMRSPELRSRMLENPGMGIWRAESRDAAIAFATDLMGADGSKLFAPGGAASNLPPSDLALMADPAFMAGMASAFPAMFAFGVQGYADDRLADGPGWGSFDVKEIRCPVTVLHGASDSICPVEHARHTASVVPGARLEIRPELGHFSIISEVLGELARL